MSLRDQFAREAMSGLCVSDNIVTDDYAQWIAKTSYRIADAMLAERDRNPSKTKEPKQ